MILSGMRTKNNINRVKHKIDFMDAIQVFFDERRISKIDNRHDYGESRYHVIGMSNERVLFVVYTERSENTITAKEVKTLKGKTNWKEVDEITDAEIEEAAKSDPDSALPTDEELKQFKPVKKNKEEK